MALAVHALLFALAIRSVKITGPPPEPPAIGVQLIQLRPPPPRREPPQTDRSARSSAPASAAPPPPAPAVVAPAAPAALPTTPSPSDDGAGRVRAMLRGSTGCDSAGFLKLSEAEQRRCAQWRTAHVDPGLRIPAPIDPVKQAWYEADLKYRDMNRRMPMGPPGSASEEGKKLLYGAPPGHGLFRIGPLNVGLPPGSFNDDSAPPP